MGRYRRIALDRRGKQRVRAATGNFDIGELNKLGIKLCVYDVILNEEDVLNEITELYDEYKNAESLDDIPSNIVNDVYMDSYDLYSNMAMGDDGDVGAVEKLIEEEDWEALDVSVESGYYSGVQIYVSEKGVDYYYDDEELYEMVRDELPKEYVRILDRYFDGGDDNYYNRNTKVTEALEVVEEKAADSMIGRDKEKLKVIMDKAVKEYGWMYLRVSARFSSGETWYEKLRGGSLIEGGNLPKEDDLLKLLDELSNTELDTINGYFARNGNEQVVTLENFVDLSRIIVNNLEEGYRTSERAYEREWRQMNRKAEKMLKSSSPDTLVIANVYENRLLRATRKKLLNQILENSIDDILEAVEEQGFSGGEMSGGGATVR